MSAPASQVHCLLDCYAELLGMCGRDARPLYLGVWNAYFEVTEAGLSYYSDSVDELAKWRARFERMYGCGVQQWHASEAGKQPAIDRLRAFMTPHRPERHSILMVDLFDLPYSNQYRERHSPHYLVVVRADGEHWQIRDPYLSWNGVLTRKEVGQAFMREGAVLAFDLGGVGEPRPDAIRAIYEEEATVRDNRLLAELNDHVRRAVERGGGYAPKRLLDSIQHVAVIAKRMEGFRYALRYFADEDGEDAREGGAWIAELSRGFEGLLFLVARYEMTGTPFDYPAFARKVERLQQFDLAIREELDRAYKRWMAREEGNHDGKQWLGSRGGRA